MIPLACVFLLKLSLAAPIHPPVHAPENLSKEAIPIMYSMQNGDTNGGNVETITYESKRESRRMKYKDAWINRKERLREKKYKRFDNFTDDFLHDVGFDGHMLERKAKRDPNFARLHERLKGFWETMRDDVENINDHNLHKLDSLEDEFLDKICEEEDEDLDGEHWYIMHDEHHDEHHEEDHDGHHDGHHDELPWHHDDEHSPSYEPPHIMDAGEHPMRDAWIARKLQLHDHMYTEFDRFLKDFLGDIGFDLERLEQHVAHNGEFARMHQNVKAFWDRIHKELEDSDEEEPCLTELDGTEADFIDTIADDSEGFDGMLPWHPNGGLQGIWISGFDHGDHHHEGSHDGFDHGDHQHEGSHDDGHSLDATDIFKSVPGGLPVIIGASVGVLLLVCLIAFLCARFCAERRGVITPSARSPPVVNALPVYMPPSVIADAIQGEVLKQPQPVEKAPPPDVY